MTNQSREALAHKVAAAFAKLADHREEVLQLWREFEKLKDGETIMECRNKTEFAKQVLGRSMRTVQYLLSGRTAHAQCSPVSNLPPWSAKTADGTLVEVAGSALQKAVRDGDEAAAVYWVKQLYFAHRKVWKKLHVFAAEDIGLADLTVKTHVLELEQAAGKCKNDDRHSDLLQVITATLICCRAQKSRAVDNAIHWYDDKPTWKPADAKEVLALAETSVPQPVIPDKVFDMHTAAGRKLGRGMEHFMKEGAALKNESDVQPFTPTVQCAHCGGTGRVAA